MPKLVKASSFSLSSLDHEGRVLLDSNVHSTRHLLGTESLEETPKQLRFEFTLDGEKRETVLNRERGAFAEGTVLRLAGDDGEVEEKPMPEIYAYYSEDRNWVLSFHNHGKFTGMVVDDEKAEIFHFTSENGAVHVDTNVKSYFGDMQVKPRRHLRETESEGRELKAIDYWDDCHSQQPSNSVMRIGGAVGYIMYNNYGDEVLGLVSSYIVESNMIYERQMDIVLQVADTFVATSPNAASWTASSCSISIQNQLSRMRSWNKPSNQPLWHLFDDCFGASGSILGIAYIDALCQSSINVGVSLMSDDYDAEGYPTWATVAHELGHNFNAQHSFEEGQGRTGGIMDYGRLPTKLIDGEVQFNTQYRETEVCRAVSRAVSTGCTDNFSEIAEVELASKAEAFRDLNCVKRSHRGVTAKSNRLFLARTGVTLAQCKTQCESNAACDSFTFSNTGHCETFTDIDTSDLVYAAQFDSYFCSEGDAPSGRFAIKSVDDLLQEANTDAIEASCCEVLDNQHVEGLNRWVEDNVSKEQCHLQCIQNTGCSAASYDISYDLCMFYGGPDYSDEFYDMNGAFTLKCDRECVADRALGVASDDEGSIAAGIVPVAGIIAAVGLLGLAYRRFTKKSSN